MTSDSFLHEKDLPAFWKSVFLKCALVFISSGFGLGVFLLGDRIYSDRVLKKAPLSGANTCLIYHEVRHHAMMRRCSGQLLWGKASIPVFTNNLGLRDARVRDVSLDRGDRTRILFVGDSFTFGYNPWEDTFVGMVSTALSSYDVLNAGTQSYSPSTYYLMVLDLLKKGVQIDEVIIFLDISDIQDEAASYLDVSDGTIALREHYSYEKPAYNRFRKQVTERWLLTNTAYTFVERLLVKIGVLWLPREYDAFDSPRGGWTYRSGLDDALFPEGYAPGGVSGGIQKALQKMDRLFTLVHNHGISLSVAVYPWPAQLVHDGLNSRQVTIWEAWCQGKCKRFINLFPDFFSEMRRCPLLLPGCWYETLFVFGDIHFNAYGNSIVARRLLQELTRTPVSQAINDPGNPLRAHRSGESER